MVLAVLPSSSVPLQPLISHPLSGTAPLRAILSSSVYWPAAQPVELAGEATGSVPWPLWPRVRV